MTRREIHPDDEDLRLLRIEQVLELIPIGRSSLYRMIDNESFPTPAKLGTVSVWPAQEIRDWKETKFSRGKPGPKPASSSRRDHAGLI